MAARSKPNTAVLAPHHGAESRMFGTLTERLSGILSGLTRRGALTEEDVNARCARCAGRCWRPMSRWRW